jgi:molecular chaperone DnaK (HSP70)
LFFFQVILSGGTSKIPRLQKNIFALFPSAEYLTNLNTDEVTAVGAAYQASLVEDKQDFGDFEEKVKHIIKVLLQRGSL